MWRLTCVGECFVEIEQIEGRYLTWDLILFNVTEDCLVTGFKEVKKILSCYRNPGLRSLRLVQRFYWYHQGLGLLSFFSPSQYISSIIKSIHGSSRLWELQPLNPCFINVEGKEIDTKEYILYDSSCIEIMKKTCIMKWLYSGYLCMELPTGRGQKDFWGARKIYITIWVVLYIWRIP